MNQVTLLEIVQSTLGSMDSDAVSTIGETIESEQIAMLAKEHYLRLATYQDIPQMESLTQLVGLGDTSRATMMKMPDNALRIKDIRYKVTNSGGETYFQDIYYVERDSFLSSSLALNIADTNVSVNVLDGNVRIPYRNDTAPTCWTTFDDEFLMFDSIEQGVGVHTLTNDNSLVIAYIVPPFEMRDDFVPDIPMGLYTQYMDQIKETASHEQKQTPSDVRTRDSNRQQHRKQTLPQ